MPRFKPIIIPPERLPKIKQRFLAAFEVAANGCWIWKKRQTKWGYGEFEIATPNGRKKARAHRVAWVIFIGPIPETDPGTGHRVFVCHNCPGGDNKLCVNPSHLWLGSPLSNTRDAIKKGQRSLIHTEKQLAAARENIKKAAAASVASRKAKTHCRRGHEFTPETTRINADGNRWCRICLRLGYRKAWERRRRAAGQLRGIGIDV